MAITAMQQVLNERLKMYLEAEKVVLRGEEYQIGSRRLRRANLSEIRQAIDDLIAAGATLDDEVVVPGRIKRAVFVE